MTLAALDRFVEQLFEIMKRFTRALSEAGVDYRLIGGMAAFLHVNERNPIAARFTSDIDTAVRRSDLDAIVRAVEPFGFVYRHAAGVDMLLDSVNPGTRSGVHLIFIGEKVRAADLEPVPDFSEGAQTIEGALVAPVADLVRMKLTSFRLKDKVHIQDLDGVGLITPEIEAQLPDLLRHRLAEVRASD
jgi:hypothetical protein